MTRVIFWNMMNFSQDRIQNQDYLDNILFTVHNPDRPADVFVLIELPAGHKNVGEFLRGDKGPALGALQLKDELNEDPNLPDQGEWHLVPPIITGTGGQAEGIAVYYRSDRLDFQGPWQCVGPAVAGPNRGKNGITTVDPLNIPQGLVVQNAAPPWDTALPAAHNHFGGRWMFTDANDPANTNLYFARAKDRKPWLVEFRERQGLNRVIQVVGFHPPPPSKKARHTINALDRATEAQELRGIRPPDVRVFGGDFNLNAAIGAAPNEPYDTLTNLVPPYSWAFAVQGTEQGPNNVHFNTTIKPYRKKRQYYPKTTITDAGPYPQYKYTANNYDQIFTMHAPGQGAAANQGILNLVTGTQENRLGAPGLPQNFGYQPNPPAQGAAERFTYPTRMTMDIQTILAGPFNAGQNAGTVFRQYPNYGHIRNTSDHMAVVIDV